MVWTAHLTPLSLFGSPPFIFISYFAIPLACFASHNLLRCASGCTNTGYDPPKRTPNSIASSSPLGWLTVCPCTSDLIYHASMHLSSIRHASAPPNTFSSKDLSREYFLYTIIPHRLRFPSFFHTHLSKQRFSNKQMLTLFPSSHHLVYQHITHRFCLIFVGSFSFSSLYLSSRWSN